MRRRTAWQQRGDLSRRLVEVVGSLLAVSLLGTACGRGDKPTAPPPPEVLVTEVVQKEVPVYGEWIGVMTGFINADIRPQVKGYLLAKLYHEGDVVKANQALFQIDPREFQAQFEQARANLAQNLAILKKNQLDVARYTPLAREGAVSQQELDNAIQATQASQATVDAAKAAVDQARLNLDWTKVTSLIDGVAGIAQAQVGDLVDLSTVMTTVSQLDPIKVRFPIAEQEYLRLARARAAGDTNEEARRDDLRLILADGTTYPSSGKVYVVGREVDPRTGTLTIEGLFPNPRNVLRPGGYAKVRAQLEVLPKALVVPQAAVADVQGATQVAVVLPDNTVEMRNVVTGPRDGFYWAIASGVKAGERVIVEGVQKVRGGVKVSPKPFAVPTPGPTATPMPF
ncbi:efflux RND transporter periplasmic adaptor subunit [Candidatus Binatia bacterium]|nr:efflux RND transporter periplasmic adaptor subunit [Candidatus Binatia bacterium]